MTHTPGPWKEKGLKVTADGRGVICVCPVVSLGGTFNVDANVHLIAAAPNMFAALKKLIEFEDSALIDDHVPTELINKVRTLIARVEGDSNA